MIFENTYASLISNFGDFLTVAIHTILYERHIYPLPTFITAKKWNYPIRQSRHPKVCKWINDAVAAVQEELFKGTVERVAVVIYSQYSQPLERFMFDLSKFPVVGKGEWYTPIERVDASGVAAAAATTQPKQNSKQASVDLEEQFRAVMAKLTVCDTMLKPIPSGCTFTVAIELKEMVDAPIGHPQPWIPVQPSLQREVPRYGSEDSAARSGSDLGGVATTPIRSVEAGEMMFEMWIEEGVTKGNAIESATSTQLSV
jgi:mitotic spindle assembly checkpoint protein MAD2B